MVAGHVFVFRQLNSGKPGKVEAGLVLEARFSGRGTCNSGGHAGGLDMAQASNCSVLEYRMPHTFLQVPFL